MNRVRRALVIAGAYFLFAGLYIFTSSRIAAALANDVGDLQRFETLKGMGFVTLTAVVLFGATHWTLRQAERGAQELARQRNAIVANERQALAGMMAAAIAHDANNVLMALMLELELLPRHDARDEAALANAHASAKRLVDLNRRLSTAGRQTTAHDLREVGVRAAVVESLETLRAHHALRGCQIRLAPSDEHFVRASPVLLHQVLSNLVVNAGEATSGAGTIEIRVEESDAGMKLEVHDDGPGVPRERREGLFTALKTTKATGTGLGLYSASACAVALGGTLEIDDSPLGGACFRVVLPAEQEVT